MNRTEQKNIYQQHIEWLFFEQLKQATKVSNNGR